MKHKRPYVISVAGFDPSGGAGLLADCKTFEANKVYGLAVVTANTIQTENQFVQANWVAVETIKQQLQVLFDNYNVEVMKFGIVENLQLLNQLIDCAITLSPSIKIVLDPVLQSSTGFDFLSVENKELLVAICKKVYVITPNFHEAQQLGSSTDAKANAKELSTYTHVFLKGGHDATNSGQDVLYTTNGKEIRFNPKERFFPKHGSGCILSAALTAQLAKGFPLQKACLKAKTYTQYCCASNSSLLAFHKL